GDVYKRQHQINASLRSMTRYYYSRFHNQMNVEWMSQGVMAGQEEFGQRVHVSYTHPTASTKHQ
ncbi:hypothetical protein, partial [Sphingobacterium daejeonense]|uniref:hypothetical protein n=1 Tax=Sphingobacterium daejeonense TaxID=371142 RepID=UPI003D32226D